MNPLTLLNSLPGALAQGLIWGIMAIGVAITYKILDYADLTVDNSLCTGGAVAAVCIIGGMNPLLALLCAVLAGALAGLCTGLLHTVLGIPAILSGILTQLALYSINMHIMGGKSNLTVSRTQYQLLLSSAKVPAAILVSGIFVIAIVALLYVGSIEINVGGMASGDVIALVNYMNQILVELVKLANLIVQVSKALACAGRVQAVLDTEPGMEFPAALKGEAPADKAGDAVRFDHVSLTYAGAGAPSLTDISFTAKRGQTIGVIGGTGSGKSSLINLIPRFYDATEGTVEILGRPAQEYPRAALRGSVAVVMQKAQLFGGTIRSNLLWGNKNAADADLWAALETAQAADFVRAKPLGLDEPVEQGGRNLSGGQKQRLTIARALVGKPDILILDDSASALDYATDAALRKALAALPGALTVFIVSQRAASLQHADQILVLDDGHLVGIGTHSALRSSCPVYEEIYESQFKKGEAEA